MLTVSLFNGTTKIHDKLIRDVPQGHTGERHLIMLAVIHEADEKAGIYDAKVMLYQDAGDPTRFWIRKENVQTEGRTNYVEADFKDALAALIGFEASARAMQGRLVDKKRADRLDHSVATMRAPS